MPEYNAGVPIYLQITADIQRMIVSGNWPPGERIPSVRELALRFQVNPNTMQRALAELEREGLVYTERTAGRFVTDDGKRIAELRQKTARQALHDLFCQLSLLGYRKEEILELLKEWRPEE